MAREILLRLALRNYERARDVAAQAAERTQRTLATAKAVAGELREGLERAQKLAEVRRASAVSRRTGPGRDSLDDEQRAFRQDLAPLGQWRARGEAFGRILSGDMEPSRAIPALMTGVAPFVPGAGILLTLLAPLTDKLLSVLEERLQRELKRETDALKARFAEERFQADYSRRLREDPAFARSEARRALTETLQEEAVMGKRIEKTRADLVLDFGL